MDHDVIVRRQIHNLGYSSEPPIRASPNVSGSSRLSDVNDELHDHHGEDAKIDKGEVVCDDSGPQGKEVDQDREDANARQGIPETGVACGPTSCENDDLVIEIWSCLFQRERPNVSSIGV